MKTLQQVMTHIAQMWRCDPDRYPALREMTPDQRLNFLVKHSLMHISKSTGVLGAECENFDHHGGFPDYTGKVRSPNAPVLQTAAVKLFVNSLKLAEEVGLSAEDLLELAPQYVK